MQPKISVIVPVYNSEKFLKQCLDSIRFQSYEDLEIICIDDGSSDGSLDILKEYKQNDERIVVVTQENKGVGAARNLGMTLATGDYIAFVDSDDWVLLDLYQTFVDKINDFSTKVDVYMFNVAGYVEGQNDSVARVFFDMSDWRQSKNGIYTIKDCIRPFSRNMAIYNRIYRAEYLRENEIIFPEDIKYEDQLFSFVGSLYANSIIINEKVYYRYRNFASKSLTLESTERVFGIFKIVDMVEAEIMKSGTYEHFKYALFQYKFSVFSQHYGVCPEELREKYFNTMKNRLVTACTDDLDMNICRQLRSFEVYELVVNSNWNQFRTFLEKKR